MVVSSAIFVKNIIMSGDTFEIKEGEFKMLVLPTQN